MPNDPLVKKLVRAITDRNDIEIAKDKSVPKLTPKEVEALAIVTAETLKDNPKASANDIFEALLKDPRSGLKPELARLSGDEKNGYVLQQLAQKQAGIWWGGATPEIVRTKMTEQLLPTIDGMLKENRESLSEFLKEKTVDIGALDRALKASVAATKPLAAPEHGGLKPTVIAAIQPAGTKGYGV